MAEQPDVTEQLIQARVEIERLKGKAATTLSGTEFLTLLFMMPIIISFVLMGTVIIWRTTSNPAEVAPHLVIILVAFAIFASPVGAGLGAITGRFSDEGKRKDK